MKFATVGIELIKICTLSFLSDDFQTLNSTVNYVTSQTDIVVRTDHN